MSFWTLTLMVFLCVVAATVSRTRDLLSSVILMSVFSLISALLFVTFDAPDVAATEAAVGAGLSTILMLMALCRLPRFIYHTDHITWPFIVLLVAMAGMLLFGMLLAPALTGGIAPLHGHPLALNYPSLVAENGINNLVTAILAIYRGFDTLGETLVIFIAAAATVMLLVPANAPTVSSYQYDPNHSIPLLTMSSRFFIPAILLFALYIQTHGEDAPGGGFQAGVLFAVAFLLHHLIISPEEVHQWTFKILLSLGACAVGLYATTGLVGAFISGSFLSYHDFSTDYKHAMHIGVFLVETSVGLGVACSVSLLLSAIGYRPHGVITKRLFAPFDEHVPAD